MASVFFNRIESVQIFTKVRLLVACFAVFLCGCGNAVQIQCAKNDSFRNSRRKDTEKENVLYNSSDSGKIDVGYKNTNVNTVHNQELYDYSSHSNAAGPATPNQDAGASITDQNQAADPAPQPEIPPKDDESSWECDGDYFFKRTFSSSFSISGMKLGDGDDFDETVKGVEEGSWAWNNGIRPGDIIHEIAGQKAHTVFKKAIPETVRRIVANNFFEKKDPEVETAVVVVFRKPRLEDVAFYKRVVTSDCDKLGMEFELATGIVLGLTEGSWASRNGVGVDDVIEELDGLRVELPLLIQQFKKRPLHVTFKKALHGCAMIYDKDQDVSSGALKVFKRWMPVEWNGSLPVPAESMTIDWRKRIVVEVVDGGWAATNGIKKGDVINWWKEVDEHDRFATEGQKITRGQNDAEVPVVLGRRPVVIEFKRETCEKRKVEGRKNINQMKKDRVKLDAKLSTRKGYCSSFLEVTRPYLEEADREYPRAKLDEKTWKTWSGVTKKLEKDQQRCMAVKQPMMQASEEEKARQIEIAGKSWVNGDAIITRMKLGDAVKEGVKIVGTIGKLSKREGKKSVMNTDAYVSVSEIDGDSWEEIGNMLRKAKPEEHQVRPLKEISPEDELDDEVFGLTVSQNLRAQHKRWRDETLFIEKWKKCYNIPTRISFDGEKSLQRLYWEDFKFWWKMVNNFELPIANQLRLFFYVFNKETKKEEQPIVQWIYLWHYSTDAEIFDVKEAPNRKNVWTEVVNRFNQHDAVLLQLWYCFVQKVPQFGNFPVPQAVPFFLDYCKTVAQDPNEPYQSNFAQFLGILWRERLVERLVNSKEEEKKMRNPEVQKYADHLEQQQNHGKQKEEQQRQQALFARYQQYQQQQQQQGYQHQQQQGYPAQAQQQQWHPPRQNSSC